MAMKKFTRARRSAQFESFREHVELQRSRLMDAEALLDCVIAAMDDDGRLDETGPSYPNVVCIVRALVHSVIDLLDSVNVGVAVVVADVSAETLGEGKDGGVKEVAAAYVH